MEDSAWCPQTCPCLHCKALPLHKADLRNKTVKINEQIYNSVTIDANSLTSLGTGYAIQDYSLALKSYIFLAIELRKAKLTAITIKGFPYYKSDQQNGFVILKYNTIHFTTSLFPPTISVICGLQLLMTGKT